MINKTHQQQTPATANQITVGPSVTNRSYIRVDGLAFRPDGLTAEAAQDPIGRVIVSSPRGELGVEAYQALKGLCPNGKLTFGVTDAPNFSDIAGSVRTVSNLEGVEMVVSGGQTGVDQAAFKFAKDNSLETCGIVPKDRMTAKGPLAASWSVIENLSTDVDVRTQHNFALSDGTLALNKRNVTDGTVLTIQGPIKMGRPLFVVDMDAPIDANMVTEFKSWLRDNKIRCLNIGGPRHSYYDGKPLPHGDIEEEARRILEDLFRQ